MTSETGEGDDNTLLDKESLKDLLGRFEKEGQAQEASEGEDGAANSGESERCRAGCAIWDLCGDAVYAAAILECGLLAVLKTILDPGHDEEGGDRRSFQQGRLYEIAFGILGNVATHRALRQRLLEDQALVTLAVDSFVTCFDPSALRELSRLLAHLARKIPGDGAGDLQWLVQVMCTDGVATKLSFILQNSLDEQVLAQGWYLALVLTHAHVSLWKHLEPFLDACFLSALESSTSRNDLTHVEVSRGMSGLECCLRTLEVHISRREAEADAGPPTSTTCSGAADSRVQLCHQLLGALEALVLGDQDDGEEHGSVDVASSAALVLRQLLDLLLAAPKAAPPSTSQAADAEEQGEVQPGRFILPLGGVKSVALEEGNRALAIFCAALALAATVLAAHKSRVEGNISSSTSSSSSPMGLQPASDVVALLPVLLSCPRYAKAMAPTQLACAMRQKCIKEMEALQRLLEGDKGGQEQDEVSSMLADLALARQLFDRAASSKEDLEKAD